MQSSPFRSVFSVLTTRVSYPKTLTRRPVANVAQTYTLQREFKVGRKSRRNFSAAKSICVNGTSTQKAKDLNQQGLEEQESSIGKSMSQENAKQIRTPWHREGSNVPPVARQRSAGAMTMGK